CSAGSPAVDGRPHRSPLCLSRVCGPSSKTHPPPRKDGEPLVRATTSRFARTTAMFTTLGVTIASALVLAGATTPAQADHLGKRVVTNFSFQSSNWATRVIAND